MCWCAKSVKFNFRWETKNRRLGTSVTQFQDSKPRKKQIALTFFYFVINNALLYHFIANLLAHNEKMTEKSVFRETWSPKMTSQSFPVSCFWSRGFSPHRTWNLTVLVHQNTGKENRSREFFWLYLSVHWGDLTEQIKKICHIHFKFDPFFQQWHILLFVTQFSNCDTFF